MAHVEIGAFGNGSELDLEDCDALLNFPFQDYVSVIKQEKGKANSASNCKEASEYQSPSIEKGEVSRSCDLTFEDVATIEDCLARNGSMQQEVFELMRNVNRLIQKNEVARKNLEERIEEEKRIKNERSEKFIQSRSLVLFSAPYFRNQMGMTATFNEDAVQKIKDGDITALYHKSISWNNEEKQMLKHGVHSMALSYVLKPTNTKRDFLISKVKDPHTPEEQIEGLKKQIAKLEKKIEKIRAKDINEIVAKAEADNEIDWMTIAATNLEGERTELECEIMWKNYLSAFINKSPFTKDEDKQIEVLAKKYKGCNWDQIAVELNTQRPAIQCFIRFITHINAENLKKRFWTPEEDKKLLEAVELCRIGDQISWGKVVFHMEGRTKNQLRNRYERTLSSNIKRAKWTPEEDAMLLASYSKFRGKYTRMSEFFIGRPSYHIRERYINTLRPSVKMGSWTEEEDQMLINSVQKHGWGNWGKMAKEIHGRTDNMCFIRCRTLLAFAYKNNSFKKAPNKITVHDLQALIPGARSKDCSKANINLAVLRQKARDTLKDAVIKISPNIQEVINPETLDFSRASVLTLYTLQKELFQNVTDPSNPSWQPKYKDNKGKKKSMRFFEMEMHASATESESDVDDLDQYMSDMEEKKNPWLERLLESKFEEGANAPPAVPQSTALNSTRPAVECYLYQKYLQEELNCKPDCETICDDFGYNMSLAVVVCYFVQPDIDKDNDMFTVAPNATTMGGYDMLLHSKDRLQRTSQFVEHSRHYHSFLFSHTKERPKCVKCSGEEGESDVQVLTDLLKSKLLVANEEMLEAVAMENRVTKEDECVCAELIESRTEFLLLEMRFFSLFLLPHLFSIGLTQKQAALVYQIADDDFRFLDIYVPKQTSEKKSPLPKKRKYSRKPRKVKRHARKKSRTSQSTFSDADSSDEWNDC